MIDPLDLELELVKAEDALHKAAAFLARYDEAQAALNGMAPGWQSPLSRTVNSGLRAADRLAAYVQVLTGESAIGVRRADAGPFVQRDNGAEPFVRQHGDPGE